MNGWIALQQQLHVPSTSWARATAMKWNEHKKFINFWFPIITICESCKTLPSDPPREAAVVSLKNLHFPIEEDTAAKSRTPHSAQRPQASVASSRWVLLFLIENLSQLGDFNTKNKLFASWADHKLASSSNDKERQLFSKSPCAWEWSQQTYSNALIRLHLLLCVSLIPFLNIANHNSSHILLKILLNLSAPPLPPPLPHQVQFNFIPPQPRTSECLSL